MTILYIVWALFIGFGFGYWFSDKAHKLAFDDLLEKYDFHPRNPKNDDAKTQV
jgi:hypothetical protein